MKRVFGLLLLLVVAGTAQDTTTASVPATPAPATTSPAVVSPSESPDTSWKRELVGSVNGSSSYYQDWADGSEDALAWSSKLQGRLEHDTKDWNWVLKGSALFGQVKLGDRALRKTDDELKGETVLSRKLTRYVDPFVSAGFQTQFAAGYKYPSDTVPRVQVSNFIDPLYLSQGLGVGTAPVDWLRTRLGGAIHEVRTDGFPAWSDDPKTTSVEYWKVEPGIEWVTEIKKTLADHLLLESNLSVFSNLKGSDEVVTIWTASAAYQFSKYVNVNVATELHHDIQQSEAWQWKQRLSLGLTCSFL